MLTLVCIWKMLSDPQLTHPHIEMRRKHISYLNVLLCARIVLCELKQTSHGRPDVQIRDDSTALFCSQMIFYSSNNSKGFRFPTVFAVL